MLFKGNSSRLQLLIEKIQSNNKDNNDEQDIEGKLTYTARYVIISFNFLETRFIHNIILYNLSFTRFLVIDFPYGWYTELVLE